MLYGDNNECNAGEHCQDPNCSQHNKSGGARAEDFENQDLGIFNFLRPAKKKISRSHCTAGQYCSDSNCRDHN
jgi:hypothetical protein